MSTTRIAAAVVLALVGAVFFGQGIGLIQGSFMTGQSTWALIGLGLVATALFLIVRRR